MRRKVWTMLILAACMAPALATADQFDAVRLRWQARLVGPATLDRAAPDVAAQLRRSSDAARRQREAMHVLPVDALWDDIAAFRHPNPILASAAVTSNARRIAQLAQAYATPGSPSYHDPRLIEAINAGLDWLLRTHYVAGRPAVGNWWDWQIGTPQALLDTLTLAYDALPAALRERCLASIRWYMPDPRVRARADGSLSDERETGANLLDKSFEAVLAGVLRKDSQAIAVGRDAIGTSLELVEHGDGFYRDGSFIQHTSVPYTGSYGLVLLTDYARLLYLLDGSAWPMTDPRVGRIFAWARDSFMPLMIDGAMPDAFRGRRISTREYGDRRAGRALIAALADLAALAPQADAAAMRAAIKGWMRRDRSNGEEFLASPPRRGEAGFALFELALLKAIAADPGVAAAPEPQGARVFASMDRALLRGPGFAAVLSMTSPRTTAFEAGNGENLRGWWTGMGMLALYDADQAQFGPEFWATVDPRRLPGTTTDGSGTGRPREWTQFANPEPWVGGASMGAYAAIGMAFSMREVSGSPLHGRKSWFFLEDRILAMGSGIGAGQGATKTMVENRRLSDPAGARFGVDGVAMASGSKHGARWAYFDSGRSGSRVGYVFPRGASVRSERAEHCGSWRDINDHAETAQVFCDTYQQLAVLHGRADYVYLLLPGATKAHTRAVAARSDMRIEANDAKVAAVSLPDKGVYAANLWDAGSAPRDGHTYVSSSGPAAVVVHADSKQLRIVVAEPTQREQVLELTVGEAVGAVVSLSDGVTVLQSAPVLKLRIDTAKAGGAGFHASFVASR